MKRMAIILASLLLLSLLAACGESAPLDLSFTNSLDVSVHNLYISPIDQDTWGDPITVAKVDSGHTINFNFVKIGDDAGPGDYDIGAIDENGMNYDVPEVHLEVGDAIDLKASGDSCTYTIVHADGSKDTFSGYVYASDSE